MQTNLAKRFQDSKSAGAIEAILRSCVHCGFCNATCPTYQILGDELDGPRGRIYQMKLYFEGAEPNREIQLHLDRCLTCRSCETTCPSGVQYSRLLEFGREQLEKDLPRSASAKSARWVITHFLNSGWIFSWSVRFAQMVAGLLPASLRQNIPARQIPLEPVTANHTRSIIMLSGCVQPVLTPNTNAAAINVLSRLGIRSIEVSATHCCGAVGTHTSQPDQGRRQARRLIDLWWPQVEAGVEAIVITATGCGVMVKDYAHLFAQEPAYAEKARVISTLACDLSELVDRELDAQEIKLDQKSRVAFHTPCTMQHGLGINGLVEKILERVGYQVCQVNEAHLCCGSAGTYSILQPGMSKRLLKNKQLALSVEAPDIIATANIGCQLHIANGLDIPVVHWVELVNRALD